MTKRVLIIDRMHESILEMLQAHGLTPDYQPEIRRSEILEKIDAYFGLVVRSKTAIDRELISAATNLRFVARAGAGLDKMDLVYLKEKGIVCINAPEGNRDALGEHNVGVLLALLHRLHLADREVRGKIWDREGNRGTELGGKTVGIFGYGFMGSAFAEKLRGFGCRIIAYDKYKTGFSAAYVKEVSLETFFQETEILSIHVPLTSETANLFDVAYLRQFPRLKVILNSARGGIMSNETILTLLDEGALIGAGLDVLENEKLNKLTEKEQAEFDQLAHSDRVILTPHVAGWSHESYRRINEVIVEKLVASKLV